MLTHLDILPWHRDITHTTCRFCISKTSNMCPSQNPIYPPPNAKMATRWRTTFRRLSWRSGYLHSSPCLQLSFHNFENQFDRLSNPATMTWSLPFCKLLSWYDPRWTYFSDRIIPPTRISRLSFEYFLKTNVLRYVLNREFFTSDFCYTWTNSFLSPIPRLLLGSFLKDRFLWYIANSGIVFISFLFLFSFLYLFTVLEEHGYDFLGGGFVYMGWRMDLFGYWYLTCRIWLRIWCLFGLEFWLFCDLWDGD